MGRKGWEHHVVGSQENPGNFIIFVPHVLCLGQMLSSIFFVFLFAFLLRGNSFLFLCLKQPERIMCVEKGLKIEYTGGIN